MKIKFTAALALALATLPIHAEKPAENPAQKQLEIFTKMVEAGDRDSITTTFVGKDSTYTFHKDTKGNTFVVGKKLDPKNSYSTIIPFETEADKAKAPQDLRDALAANEKFEAEMLKDQLKIKLGEKEDNSVRFSKVTVTPKKQILDFSRKQFEAQKMTPAEIEAAMKKIEAELDKTGYYTKEVEVTAEVETE